LTVSRRVVTICQLPNRGDPERLNALVKGDIEPVIGSNGLPDLADAVVEDAQKTVESGIEGA